MDVVIFMQGGTRYYSISNYLIEYFGRKTIKLSIDAGFTCPNRDGSLGIGGCSFCSSDGSGELAAHICLDGEEGLIKQIDKSIERQVERLINKWPDAAHIAYLQSHTNTYAPVSVLKKLYFAILENPKIDGIAIATRPDCLGIDENGESEILDLLSEINKEHFLWVELGLQTSNDATLKKLNTCYTSSEYKKAASALSSRGIRFVSHLILGLPGETYDDMVNSVNFVCKECPKPFGLKLHLMNLVKNSPLAIENGAVAPEHPGNYAPYFSSIEEYISLVTSLLEIIPSDITIHRLTGDVPRKLLISPEWSYKKRTILNGINKMLKDKNTYQGRLA